MLVSLREWSNVKSADWSILLDAINEFSALHELKPVVFSMEPLNKKENEALLQTGMELVRLNSVQELYLAMQSAKIAVNMRLHASILTVSAGIPSLIVSYSDKVKGQFEFLDIKQGISITNINAKKAEFIKKMNTIFNETAPHFNLEALASQNINFLQQNC